MSSLDFRQAQKYIKYFKTFAPDLSDEQLLAIAKAHVKSLIKELELSFANTSNIKKYKLQKLQNIYNNLKNLKNIPSFNSTEIYNACKVASADCKNKSEFQLHYRKLYILCVENDWLADFFPKNKKTSY